MSAARAFSGQPKAIPLRPRLDIIGPTSEMVTMNTTSNRLPELQAEVITADLDVEQLLDVPLQEVQDLRWQEDSLAANGGCQ
jgi:hypothetical protein